jgi:hypothetical protein
MNGAWFDYTSEAAIQQGDLLWKCPLIQVAQESLEAETKFQVENAHAVVMTQSCDLVLRRDGKPKTETVLLARYLARTELSKHPKFSQASAWEEVRKGRLARFHVLNKAKLTDGVEDFALVDLGATFSLPFHLAMNSAKETDTRPRLLSPYREHLSQAFARYYMRVGLPSDIPPFT